MHTESSQLKASKKWKKLNRRNHFYAKQLQTQKETEQMKDNKQKDDNGKEELKMSMEDNSLDQWHQK